MLDRFLSPRRVQQIQRFLRNGKITVLCLILTVIVLRANLGAGKFGTPEQDFNEIRETFSYIHRRAEPRRVLEEARQTFSAKRGTEFGKSDSNSYTDFDSKKIFVDEEEDGDEVVYERDPNKPYSLGPKISDWDVQRAEWLKKNPNFPNFITPKKPRVLLVTGSSPKPCENPVGDHYLVKAIKNKMDYCRLHGIEIFYNMALLDAEMDRFWAKLPLLRKLLLSHPEVEFLWWMDSDAMFTDMVFELPWERYKDHNFVMHGWDYKVYDHKNWIGLNTGSFLLRNCQWSLDILDVWATMGPKGVRDEAGELLTRELKDRPHFEADDQSAMVYILATQKEKWADKVYLEEAYYLHGYWGILVDRYEEMIENYHPGLGDHRWPLVTHFVGCKPCAKVGDYSFERCFKQMDRASHFGDNQILQMYGFTHKSLASRNVKRTRNDTSNPTEVNDELGLLHPSFKAVKENVKANPNWVYPDLCRRVLHNNAAVASPVDGTSGSHELGFYFPAATVSTGALAWGSCSGGSIEECMMLKVEDEEEEDEGELTEMDSESHRRILLFRRRRYISCGALFRDRVPCSRRGYSYYNCRPGARVNPYVRGCSAITRCRTY